ncbi:NAD(P)-binding domain-containing protein [Belliella sp. DSM 111904]|uniref:NAD(P)-binding domain-containing protein n=1 Tax=Belliella filtrata TaxID=2923435 RepID=A0ABS9V589_9BACT|nr:NAD(P)-binding domain-containing protein [Belliella filtrata]MCH7411577.1 NAD(P)-binding domain-containing protein [Belliella filtrata]
MNLGILGSTTLAYTLGSKYIATGIEVSIGVRNGFEPKDIRWKILNMLSDKVFTYENTIAQSEVILICCENENLKLVCEALKNADLTDKILIDCTNSSFNKVFKCNTTYIQECIGNKTIYKAFNNLGLDYPKSDPLGLIKETYYCGESNVVKFRVKKLIEVVGFKAVDAGDLESAYLLEAFYHLRKEIAINKRDQTDYHFKLISV